MTMTEEAVTQLKEATLSTKLMIKESKMKYMKINRNITNLWEDLITDLKGIRILRYLGSLTNSIDVISEEIKSMIVAGRRCFYSLGQILRS
jgi:hypothetical protein